MESTYVDKNYVYAVAAIRSEELKLLNASFLDQLIQAKSADECMRILAEKGWGREDTKTPEDMLAAEREKTWETVTQFVPNRSVFDVFLLELVVFHGVLEVELQLLVLQVEVVAQQILVGESLLVGDFRLFHL